jgi:starch synthase
MRKTSVFLEACIGLDPESPKSWSGSLRSLLAAMRDAHRLDRVYSLKIPTFKRGLILAKNYTRNRALWRTQYYFDLAYRNAVTGLAAKTKYEGDLALQFGALFSLPQAFPGKQCISMHDGNLAERDKSGFGLVGVSRARINTALRYEEQAAQNMSAICTLSEYLRQSFIRNYHVHPDRVFNIGGGVNLREIPPPLPEKDYSRQRFLFVGVDFVRKGGPQLLDAFRIVRQTVPQAELHIVGPPEIPEELPGVIFHGHLSKNDPEQKSRLESLFRDASLFVMPSLYEPFGIAPLEAMLYELPCLVTDDWALKEFVTPGINGLLVQKGSVDDLAAKMLELLLDPDQLARLGRQGRATVLPQYTWPAVVKRLGKVMDSLAP